MLTQNKNHNKNDKNIQASDEVFEDFKNLRGGFCGQHGLPKFKLGEVAPGSPKAYALRQMRQIRTGDHAGCGVGGASAPKQLGGPATMWS